MATNKKPWTRHKLTNNMLQLLAKAAVDPDGRAYGDGRGHGSSSGRFGLRNRGLIDDSDNINEAGREALADARTEGW